MQDTILVVDDEREIGELIRDYLAAEGFSVVLAFDGQQGWEMYGKHQPHLAVLDIMLPKLDGMELCRRIRSESSIPILMLSAKKGETDKILGLGLGADDYVTKPFSPGELAARIKAQLRRVQQLSVPAASGSRLAAGGLEIDWKAYTVTLNSRPLNLSAKEFELLKFLAMHPSQVFTREQLFDQVWGYHDFGDINTVTVHIRKIREKLEADPSNPKFIKTVWGVGYKFEGDPA